MAVHTIHSSRLHTSFLQKCFLVNLFATSSSQVASPESSRVYVAGCVGAGDAAAASYLLARTYGPAAGWGAQRASTPPLLAACLAISPPRAGVRYAQSNSCGQNGSLAYCRPQRSSIRPWKQLLQPNFFIKLFRSQTTALKCIASWNSIFAWRKKKKKKKLFLEFVIFRWFYLSKSLIFTVFGNLLRPPVNNFFQ